MGSVPHALWEPRRAPDRTDRRENTFLDNQEYLSTVRVLEDVTRLPFILLGPIAVFQKSYLLDVNSESFTGEIGCLVFALKYS